MRILNITDTYIEFDNGHAIYFDHYQQCCENNYADFSQLDSLAREADFHEPLTFESCLYGFRFGNPPVNMFFVPCYSEQNGYYSNKLNIWYDDKEVLHGIDCCM